MTVRVTRFPHELYHRPPGAGAFEVRVGERNARPSFTNEGAQKPEIATLVFGGVEVTGVHLDIDLGSHGDIPTISALEVERIAP